MVLYESLQKDLETRIEKNFKRLSSSDYGIFQSAEYSWQGDYEGRELLAALCHYAISGKKTPWLDTFMASLPQKTNEHGFFGTARIDGKIPEQYLAGHTWFLRGLCEYYRLFGGEDVLAQIKSIVEHLYLGTEEACKAYPTHARDEKGGVSGELLESTDQWILSSDVGCAFVGLDGLTDAYALTKDSALKTLVDIMIEKFISIDVCALRFQTHATLTATRGILRMYETTGDTRYLESAKKIYALYLEKGMTANYENFNWFGREETWTEPCAIVDSFIVAIKLLKATRESKYLTLARRIWLNGLNFCFRNNGGAGTNSCVKEGQPILKILMDEAYFCCTMRYAEGLRYAKENFELLFKDYAEDELRQDERGRYFKGDRMYCKEVKDGKVRLKPIPRAYQYPLEKAKKLQLQVLF